MTSKNKNKIIISGNNSNINSTGNNSRSSFYKNIIIPSIDVGNNSNINLKPGDLARCPGGFETIVDQYGNYYCDIDPNGNGLYPFTNVDCVNGANSIINVNGNISNGCQPVNGSIVTCISGITSVVENGTYDCAQGENDIRTYTIYNYFIDEYEPNSVYTEMRKYKYDATIDKYVFISYLDFRSPFTVDFGNTSGNLNEFVEISVDLEKDPDYDSDNNRIPYVILYANNGNGRMEIGRFATFSGETSYYLTIRLADYHNTDSPTIKIVNLQSGSYEIDLEYS